LKQITFEKLSSLIYPAYLCLGDYSIALEPELIQSLKALSGEESDCFLTSLVKKVSRNKYLKGMIESSMEAESDQKALADRLKKDLIAL